jgi:hypothetical protein
LNPNDAEGNTTVRGDDEAWECIAPGIVACTCRGVIVSHRHSLYITGASALVVAIACAVSACNSSKAQARESDSRPAVADLGPGSFVGTEPAKPLDERPITPAETVGASVRD